MYPTRIGRCFIALAALLGLAAPAPAVLLYSTAARNTDPPGSLTNKRTWGGPLGADDPRRLLDSGWQWEASWIGFLGTPIAPQYFITAQHIGGAVGQSVQYHNAAGQPVSYTTTAVYDNLGTDLRIWKIDGTFDTWAPLWDSAIDGNEVGRSLVDIGRGTPRSAEVRVNGVLKGWQWGPDDRVQAWGENVVSGSLTAAQTGLGAMLYFDFDAGAGPNECALSVGDSGGAMFIRSPGGAWKLAGINYGADGPWHYDIGGAPGPKFSASLFDAGGLWAGDTNPVFIDDTAQDIPGSSYVSRISSNLTWIRSITGTSPAAATVPEPGMGCLLAVGALLSARFRRRQALADRATGR